MIHNKKTLIWNVLSVLVIVLLFSTCKAKKEVSTRTNTVERNSTAFLVEQINKHKIDAEWLSAKARIVPDGFGIGVSLSANIRVHKDKAIWMNVSKIGLEAGRALIRPDSVFIIDRFNRMYYARPIDYVESEFNLPADFSLLQEMILGNAVLLDEKNIKSKQLTDRFILSGTNTDYQTEYRLGNASYLLEEMSVNDETNQRNFFIDFDEYKTIDENTNFSHRRHIELNSEETGAGTILINFSKVEINVPKSMPFSVSPRYERG